MGIFTLANSPSRMKGVGALLWLNNSDLSTIVFWAEVFGGLVDETSVCVDLCKMVRFLFAGASTLPFSRIFLVEGSGAFLVSTTFFVLVTFFGEFSSVFLLHKLYYLCTSIMAFSNACCSVSSASSLTYV
jgi:hypothetical protein